MKVKDILKTLDSWAPTTYQESYDNSGLLVGDASRDLQSILVTLDVTMEVIDEAIQNNCNLIIAHHPIIFKGLKRITSDHWVQQCLIKAIKNDISIYAIHTNLDNIAGGVNWKIAERLGLLDVSLLQPKESTLLKLVTFIPQENAEEVLEALYAAGAGNVGNYDHCSFKTQGEGSFRPNEQANPAIGHKNIDETVRETRVELLIPQHLKSKCLSALFDVHPYEEVAYYLQPLINENQTIGSGAIGSLEAPMAGSDFINYLKDKMELKTVRVTAFPEKPVQKIALCGGSGSFLLSKAKQAGADAFITADFKYHEFFEAEGKILIADIGHYESEVFTKELIADRLRENFANIALRLSQVVTNPIKYL